MPRRFQLPSFLAGGQRRSYPTSIGKAVFCPVALAADSADTTRTAARGPVSSALRDDADFGTAFRFRVDAVMIFRGVIAAPPEA